MSSQSEVISITVISRTAYPQFKSYPSNKELYELYTPTVEEIEFVISRTKSKTGLLGLMVMLKSFQRLGYYTHPELVPQPIIIHLRTCLELDDPVSPIPSIRSIRYYQEAIREYLNISPYNNQGQELAAIAIKNAAFVRDHPADLINVAIEELIRQRYELPAFNTLDRLAGHIRTIVNTSLFKRVARKLSPKDRQNLDKLLVPDSVEMTNANLNLLKSPPKSHKLKHIKELQDKFDTMMAVGDAQQLLSFQVTVMIAAAKKVGRHKLRDSTLILIAYRHGLRVSELVALRWSQIDFAGGTIYINRLKHGVSSTHPLRGVEFRALRQLQRDYSNSNYLFVSERGTVMAAATARGIIKRAGKMAGLSLNVHPHMLRHACGFYLASRGYDTRAIQAYLGHRQIQHTVRYTELSSRRFQNFWMD